LELLYCLVLLIWAESEACGVPMSARDRYVLIFIIIIVYSEGKERDTEMTDWLIDLGRERSELEIN